MASTSKKGGILRLVIIAAALVVVASVAVIVWRQRVISRRAALAGPAIEQSIQSGDLLAARGNLKLLADPAKRYEWETKIRSAEIDHGLKVRDTDLLQVAIGDDGTPWLDAERRERVDLLLARQASQSGDLASYQRKVAAWKDSQAFAGQWFLLEADRLMAGGKAADAKQWLASKQFTGKEEAYRMARLALLDARDPAAAWAAIQSGLAADPRNGDLLSFQGQLYEVAHKPEEARRSYVAAVVAESENPLHRDTLANFYRRYGRIQEAIDTWQDAAHVSGLGVYSFKAWFWSRVTGHACTLAPCRQVGWSEVVSALTALPQGSFSSVELESSLARIPGGKARPELEWLVLLEKFRDGTPVEEVDLSNDARALWPGLAGRLRAGLAASRGKDPRHAIAGMEQGPAPADEHQFTRDFRRWAANETSAEETEHFSKFLARPDALTGILLASGWPGAATGVGGAGKFAPAPDAPEWLIFGYAKALQEGYGIPAARQWLTALPGIGPASQLLLGELMIGDGAVPEGTKLLDQVAGGGSEHAGRARWTLAMTALQRGDAAAASAAVKADPQLSASPRGAEILARAALLAGRRDEAVTIYRGILDESADAGIFLSKEAFAAGNYDEARELTLKLVQRFPEEPSFRRNLEKIEELKNKPSK